MTAERYDYFLQGKLKHLYLKYVAITLSQCKPQSMLTALYVATGF